MDIITFFTGLILGTITALIKDSFLKPLIKKISGDIYSNLVKEVYKDLDIKWLPENYSKGLSAAYTYLTEVSIPQKDENLKPEDIEKIANLVLNNFSIVDSLKKLNN